MPEILSPSAESLAKQGANSDEKGIEEDIISKHIIVFMRQFYHVDEDPSSYAHRPGNAPSRPRKSDRW